MICSAKLAIPVALLALYLSALSCRAEETESLEEARDLLASFRSLLAEKELEATREIRSEERTRRAKVGKWKVKGKRIGKGKGKGSSKILYQQSDLIQPRSNPEDGDTWLDDGGLPLVEERSTVQYERGPPVPLQEDRDIPPLTDYDLFPEYGYNQPAWSEDGFDPRDSIARDLDLEAVEQSRRNSPKILTLERCEEIQDTKKMTPTLQKRCNKLGKELKAHSIIYKRKLPTSK